MGTGMDSLQLFAQCLDDYFRNGQAAPHIMIREDGVRSAVQASLYFRSLPGLFACEAAAMPAVRGRILVAGAGAGVHALPLQEQGLDVTALEINPLLCNIMRARGIRKVVQADICSFTAAEEYDTILLLGRNIGISGTLKMLPGFLRRLVSCLHPQGQLLLDSWNFMKTQDPREKSRILEKIRQRQYPGECRFRIEYEGTCGEPFEWLYVNYSTLEKLCPQLRLNLELLNEDETANYLARITRLSSGTT